MEKKKIRVLIVEDEKDDALAILEIIREMLKSLSLEGEFCRMAKYEEAKSKLESEKYDLISLDGVLGNHQPTYPLIKTILEFNPEATAFSLSSDYGQIQMALDAGLYLGFLKRFSFGESIIAPDDLQKIKKVAENKISQS